MPARLVHDPSSGAMWYACGVSGSGTNYEKIYDWNREREHLVFSNAPHCAGVAKARSHGVQVALLDSTRYFGEMWGLTRVPRNGVERDSYDRALMTLVEQGLAGSPDLVCLAGYDLWISTWMVHRYFPKILNVHPGDPKYPGLGWIATAKAILAGEESVRSTVFFVDESDDGGPVLIQSASLQLSRWDGELREIRRVAERADGRTLSRFQEGAEREKKGRLVGLLREVSTRIQETLKAEGDWQIYPFAIHELIAKGRVSLDGRTVYVDGVQMPAQGWQVDEYGFAASIA
jgi:phosphoribosylglycinamide formyltransferase-1